MVDEKLGDKIDKLTDAIKENLDKKKPKGMGIPFWLKTNLTKGKLKRGYIIVFEVADNKHINIRKEPIIDGTIKLDNTYHAIDDDDIFYYKNKPVIIQPKKRLNPHNVLTNEESPLAGDNETYGQPYIMAKMLKDVIKGKPKISWGMAIGILIAIGVGFYFFSSSGGLS